MIGRFLFYLVSASALTCVILYSMGRFPVLAQDDKPVPREDSARAKVQSPAAPESKQAPSIPLTQVAQANPRPIAVAPEEPRRPAHEPIIIPSARLSLIKRQEVPVQREGVIKFLGKALKDGEKGLPGETVTEFGGKFYRRLRVGDVVEKDELLGLVDDVLARADLAIRVAKVNSAVADRVASEKTRDEAKKRWETLEKLRSSNNAVSIEELRGAELTYYRYLFEAISKVEAIKVAQEEEKQAGKTVEMHEIHAKIPGEVKAIYKRDGEYVNVGKGFEPVLQIQNYDRLQVEGLVDSQYASALQKDDLIVIEPTRREAPWRTFKGHGHEITGVAVSKGPDKPVIVSASEDGTVRVWDPWNPKEVRAYIHDSPVRAIACTGPAAAENLCLSGSADGKVHLWSLDASTDSPLRLMDGKHNVPVSAVAFSGDGGSSASGSDNGEIILWDTASGAARSRFPAHKAVVTMLQFFTDKDKQLHLVSVSRDNTVRIWKIGGEGSITQIGEVSRRTQDVAHVGVSSNGQQILDPRGSEMRIQTLLSGTRTMSIFQNNSQASLFRSFALFSPDAKLVLTTSSSEGILQVWRIGDDRSFELRQLYPGDRNPATCAAFDPHGRFVVGGTKDRKVYAWRLPTPAEVNMELRGTIVSVGKELVSTENQVPVIAEFPNPEAYPLLSGDIVTLVVYPRK